MLCLRTAVRVTDCPLYSLQLDKIARMKLRVLGVGLEIRESKSRSLPSIYSVDLEGVGFDSPVGLQVLGLLLYLSFNIAVLPNSVLI
jgi:hypothetical protein